jgi:hypothetical protein
MKINNYTLTKQKDVKKHDETNKQYELKMLRDKRFSQNHEKYLRLKAFAAH